MADVKTPMPQSAHPRQPDEHAGHDRHLVAAYASGDLAADESAGARDLVDRCRRCAALVEELHVVAVALQRDLVAPPRGRDFRLSAADAERLRGNAFGRFLRRLASPDLRVLQPLAGTAMAIGLVMMVVTAALPGFSGAVGGAALPAAAILEGAARDASGGEDQGAPAAEPEAPIAGGAEMPSAAPQPIGQDMPPTTEAGAMGPAASIGAETYTDASTKANTLGQVAPSTEGDAWLPLGLGLLIVGALGLLVLFVARRASRDPLLR